MNSGAKEGVKTAPMSMIQALRSAMDVMLERDPNVVIFGQDVGYFGGVFRCTEGLQKKYGKSRVFDAPISEGGIVGAAVGMGAYGLRPVPEIQFADYFYPASDQIVSEAARLRYRSAGEFTAPITIRMPCGGGIYGGQTHSQSPEALFTQVCGLRTVMPSNPYDAKGLLIASIENDDPVIFLEPKRLYNGPFDGHHENPVVPWSQHALGEVPEGYYTVPLESASVFRAGSQLTVLAYGTMVFVAEAAARETGIDAEIIDLRSLWPLDLDTILASVKKTRRCVVVHEATRTCGFGAELLSLVQEHCFYHLEAPIERVTGWDTPYPHAQEWLYFPGPARVGAAFLARDGGMMGTYIIKTPDIGEGIAEVELVAWHVREGDNVVADQLLADVMTDKATVEIPSPVAGRVLTLGGSIGQAVAVGSELIRLEVEGEGNLKAGAAPAAVTAGPAGQPAQPAKLPAAPLLPTFAVPPPPNAGERVRQVVGAAAAAAADSTTGSAAERPIASPAVRRRAWELGIPLEQVHATGPAGRIVQADLDAHARAHPGLALPAPASGTPHASAVAVPVRVNTFGELNSTEAIPVIGLRRKIAMKMQDAKRRIPHFSYVEEIDVTELEALRQTLNARWDGQRPRLTLLPLLVRAMVLALREFPQVNARFDDEVGVVTRYGAVHLGIATQTGNGLMVPVLRHAEALDLWACASEIARVADAARAGKATREELSGSTITLTSLGALGGIANTPIINHPEVAIVGVNRMVERPVVRRGAIVVRQMMNLSSSFDHRVVDGMHAAQFVQAIRSFLEAPATLFVE